MLSCSFEKIVTWTAFISNCITILGVLSIIMTLYFLYRNRLTKKHIGVMVKEIIKESDEYSDEDSKIFLRIENYTDKNFYISKIELLNEHHIYTAKEIHAVFSRAYDLIDLRPVPLRPFECLNLTLLFEVEKSTIHKDSKLIIHTTLKKTLQYNIFPRKKGSQKNKSSNNRNN